MDAMNTHVQKSERNIMKKASGTMKFVWIVIVVVMKMKQNASGGLKTLMQESQDRMIEIAIRKESMTMMTINVILTLEY
jgi:hypothetical protein